MKRAMLVTCGLVVVFGILIFSESLMEKIGAGASSVVQEYGQQRSRFEISKGGALTFVRTSRGKEIKNPNEGYVLSYQLLDKNGKKVIGKPKVVYTIGDRFPCNRLECETCQKLNDPNRAVATAITTDGALMITSSFVLDRQKEELRVARVIENISYDLTYSQPVKVRLLSAHVQYDPQLTSGIPSQFGIDRQSKRHEKPVAVKYSGPVSNFLAPGGLLFHPSCDWCPPNCDISLNLNPGENGTICVDCPGKKDSVKTHVQYFAGSVPAGPDCNHPIKIDEWGPTGVREGEKKIVCVKCDGSEFSMEVFPSDELTDDERKECTVAIKVSRAARNERGLERDRSLITPANWVHSYTGVSGAEYLGGETSTKRSKRGVLPVSELAPGQRVAIISVYSLR